MSMTITNPADPTQTYTWGTRGKRPRFVTDGLVDGTIKMPQEYIDKKVAIKIKSSEPTAKSILEEPGLKAWKWVGIVDIDPRLNTCPVRCVVVANNIGEAIRALNLTMINPVTKNEFDSCWKQISNKEFDKREKITVYQFKDNLWVERGPRKPKLVIETLKVN